MQFMLRHQSRYLVLLVGLLCLLFGISLQTSGSTIWTKTLSSPMEAEALAEELHIGFLDISSYGVARFESKDPSQNQILLDHGFSIDGLSDVLSPPWNKTTDPYLDDQYSLVETNVIDAWNITEGVSMVTVAIIDTGIDTNHIEFQGRISPYSYNAVTHQAGITYVEDDYGHGTMVAGILGATKDNGQGIAGVLQNAVLLVIKANVPESGSFSDSSVIEGIYYAVEQGANIINLSLGSTSPNYDMKTAIDYAVMHNVVVVGAAGNDGTEDAMYPASFENSISVSATDASNLVSSYSNHNVYVDLSASGTDMTTTGLDGGYMIGSGTSFAAPLVSGIIGLYLSIHPDATVAQVKSVFYGSSQDLGAAGLDSYYGYGLVDAFASLNDVYYDISFDSNGGTVFPDQFIREGDYLSILPTPSKDGCMFLGWYVDSNLETPFDRLSPITSNLTLYAAYSEGWHTVSFVTAGTAVDPILVQDGEVLNVPTSTLEGYVFIGWYIDPLRKNLYQNTPILFDMTLYAKFEEIVKYTLTYHFGDETTSLLLEEGTVPTLTDVFLEGYVFDGWFLDPDGLLPYTPTAISEDIDLYAKLTRIEFEVTTMVSGTSSVQIVGYGDEPMLMDPTLDGYVFVGWYLDSQWNTRYELAPTYENLTLYAKFSQSAYMVSFYLDDELLEETMFGIDEPILYPEVTLPGLVVSGWYLDQALTIPWIDCILTSDISLYAKMETETYTIRFLRDDGSVLSQMIALYGTPLVYPSNVQKPDTISYTYTFVGWSEEDTSVTTSKDYIAMFEQNFRIESVHLNPGVSTLYQGEPYEEAGAFSDDPLIDIVWDDTLDTTETGKYEIVYHFMDGDIEVFTLSRMIRVLERPVEIIIHLNPGIDTFEEGDSYTDPGAETNVGEIMVTGQVDVFIPGIYQIVYTVEYEGQIISKSRYVCVVGSIIWVSSPIWKEEPYDA